MDEKQRKENFSMKRHFRLAALLLAVLLLLPGAVAFAAPAIHEIGYPDNYPTTADEDGADAYAGSLNHPQSQYFAIVDFYNMVSGGTLHILEKFETYQQTTEYSCGPACARMVLHRYGVDGFLFSTMSNRVSDIPESLASYPLVLADATDAHNRFPAIVPDEVRIGRDATQRLIDAGLTRIAYIGCTAPLVAQGLRLEGYRQALEHAGIPYRSELVCDVLYNDEALRTVGRLFDEQRPDGVFCFNDSRAWYVYECAARLGLTIGEDVSVVGVDNHPVVSETFSPQLTTVELPHYEMGYWAATKLISMLADSPAEDVRWPATTAPMPPLDAPAPAMIHCTLIERDSVRDTPTD